MSTITIRTAGADPATRELDAPLLTLGRGPDNTVAITDDLVSKYHCQIVRLGEDRFLLRDCGSRNGTTLGGKPVTERLLLDGDEFVIGQTTVRFASAQATAAPGTTTFSPSTTTGMRPIGVDPARDMIGAVRELDEGLARMGARLNELASLVARGGGASSRLGEIEAAVQQLAEARGEQTRVARDLFTRSFRVDEQLRDQEARLCRFEQERVEHLRRLAEHGRLIAELSERVASLAPAGAPRARRLTVPVPSVLPARPAEGEAAEQHGVEDDGEADPVLPRVAAAR